MNLMEIPPFRDAHMHFIIDGRPAAREVAVIGGNYAGRGIFSVNEMGHRSGIGLEAKVILSGTVSVRSAGYAIHRKGTYGAFLGKSVAGKEEIKRAVREIAEAGADFVKVINSGIVCTEGADLVTEGGFTREELRIIIAEAGERDLNVVCHANSDRAIREAVGAGAVSIEHGYFVSAATLHMMAEAGVAWTPTVSALLSLSPALRPPERAYIEKAVEGHLSSIYYASSIGVKLNIGTDGGSKGVPHGEPFFDELQMFRKAGLTFEQILSAACMGNDEIEKGNFLVVKKDFIASRKIEAIFKDGKQIPKSRVS